MRRFLLPAALSLAVQALLVTGGRAFDRYSVEGPAGLPGYGLGVVDGKVCLVEATAASHDWYLRDKEKGTLIRLLTASKRDKYSGWYLSYDVKGKDKRVFLTKEPGPGSYWKVSVGGCSSRSAVSATAGKLKGWYLNLGEAEALKDAEGKSFTAYRAVLERNPKPLPLFTFKRFSA
jgi:hypothetical protein